MKSQTNVSIKILLIWHLPVWIGDKIMKGKKSERIKQGRKGHIKQVI